MLRKGYILRDPAQDLKWNMCHITNPTVYENHSKTLKMKKKMDIMDL